MNTVECAGCGATMNEADAYFGEHGMVCAPCSAAQEQADSAEFRAGAEAHATSDVIGADGSFGSSSVERRVNADGSVTTVTRTTTVDLGIVGAIFKLIMRLFGR